MRVREAAGLAPRGRARPRLHDLRHTFATAHMTVAYAHGGDPDRVLSLLATWLGHSRRHPHLLVPDRDRRTHDPGRRQARIYRRRRTVMNALAISLQTYFTTFAHTQRDLSVNTIASYRDTWRMLLKYLTTTLGIPADASRLRRRRRHARHRVPRPPRTRTWQQQQNPQRPTHRDPLRRRPGPARPSRARRHLTQVLAIPPKRTIRPIIEFLTPAEVDVRLAAPDPTTWTGRRDHALLAMTAQRTADQRDLLTDPRRHPPRRRPAHRLHRQRASPTHHPADPSHREHHDDLPR